MWKAGTNARRFAHCCMPRIWSRNRRHPDDDLATATSSGRCRKTSRPMGWRLIRAVLSVLLGVATRESVGAFWAIAPIVAEHLFSVSAGAGSTGTTTCGSDPSSAMDSGSRDLCQMRCLGNKVGIATKSEAMPLLTPANWLPAWCSGASPPSEVDQRVEGILGQSGPIMVAGRLFPKPGLATETKSRCERAQALFFWRT